MTHDRFTVYNWRQAAQVMDETVGRIIEANISRDELVRKHTKAIAALDARLRLLEGRPPLKVEP